MNEMKLYKITEFAKLCHTTPRALKHYEQLGLIQPAKILENGYRGYLLSQSDQISMIKLFQEQGLSLLEIKELMQDMEPDSVLTRLKQQKEIVERQMLDLKVMQTKLNWSILELVCAMETMNQMQLEERIHLGIVFHPFQNASEELVINSLQTGMQGGVYSKEEALQISGIFTMSEENLKVYPRCVYTYHQGRPVERNEVVESLWAFANRNHFHSHYLLGQSILESPNEENMIMKYMIVDGL